MCEVNCVLPPRGSVGDRQWAVINLSFLMKHARFRGAERRSWGAFAIHSKSIDYIRWQGYGKGREWRSKLIPDYHVVVEAYSRPSILPHNGEVKRRFVSYLRCHFS